MRRVSYFPSDDNSSKFHGEASKSRMKELRCSNPSSYNHNAENNNMEEREGEMELAKWREEEKG